MYQDDVLCVDCADGAKPCVCGERESPEVKAAYEMFVHDLELAHTHAQRALDALYRPSGPKRSILYRIALGRAQSLLIGLHVQELQRRNQRGNNRGPTEPSVEDGIGGERQ